MFKPETYYSRTGIGCLWKHFLVHLFTNLPEADSVLDRLGTQSLANLDNTVKVLFHRWRFWRVVVVVADDLFSDFW